MEQIPPSKQPTQYTVVSSIKVTEIDYIVDKPVYVDKEIEVPKFVNRTIDTIEVDHIVNELAEKICAEAITRIMMGLDQRLEEVIKLRLKPVEIPTIKEVVKIVEIPVEVHKPILKDVIVNNAVIKDVQVTNAVISNAQVTNAVIQDMVVVNAVIEDKEVIRPVFKDVEIPRPVFIDKDIIVIHPKYINLKGEFESNA